MTLEEAKKRLDDANPRGYDLVYIDYRESLDNNKEALLELVETGLCNSVFENWDDDGSWEAMNYLINEEFSEEEREDMSEEVMDGLREHMRNNDKSTPMEDLVRHTSAQWFYYPLGLGVCDNGGEESVKEIMEFLGLDDKHRKNIVELVENSYYGGEICLLFATDIDEFFCDPSKDPKFATLKAELCIMDRFNGSGHSVELDVIWKVPFDRTRFRLDEYTPGYSFAVSVCGLSQQYYETGLACKEEGEVIEAGVKEPYEPSAEEVQEKEDQARWNKVKKCRMGDMNIKRHPKDKMEYINNFPCGTKCHACGTFWVD